MDPAILFLIVWGLFIVSWLLASFWFAPIQARVSTKMVYVYRALLIVGAVLFYHRTAQLLGAPRLWHVGYAGAWALLAATCCGFLFAWWARIMLGPLWSGEVTRKEGHRVIDTGPYALVRHPIYTGGLTATLATALAKANVVALAGCVLLTAGFWLKARIEERFLAVELGEAYAAYRRRVPMLVPFAPVSTRGAFAGWRRRR